MTIINQAQNRDAALARIKTLWQEAEKITAPEETVPDPARSEIMGRIDALMYQAEKLDQNQSAEEIDHFNAESKVSTDISASAFDTNQALPTEEDLIDEIAARVNTAALAGPDIAETEDFDNVKTRMEAVSRIRPSHQDNSQTQSPEYAFGDAFSTLIRHVVRQYIDDEFEDVMRHAIKNELTRLNWEVDDTENKTSPKKRKK
ncbi:hypothetical protein AB8880_04995 [Alphaproteobacteria bacterium LSUCC0684]